MAVTESHININNTGNPKGYQDTPASDMIVIPDGGAAQRLGTALAAIAGGGVTSAVAGSGVQVSAATGAVTFSSSQAAGAAQKASNLSDLASAATARSNLGLSIDNIQFVIDGSGATITTGIKGDLVIPYACTITSATLLADQSGSIVVNVWKDTYANYPPTVGDKITASAPPTITTATKSTDSTLTGWTLSIAAGDTLRFNVDSVTTIQRVTIVLGITK